MLTLCGASSKCSWREAPQSTAVPTAAEKIEVKNTAILAAEKSVALGNVWPAMKSDIVKPMPARAPAPANCRHVYSAGLTAMPVRTAAAAARNTPAGFPMARLATIAAMSQPCPMKTRSEEHTSELQSQFHLVCRL